MGQMRFLVNLGEAEEKKVSIQFIKAFFFGSQTLLLFILATLMFFDFWNINSINSYIWLPLVLNLLLCSVIIFLLVSIKNDIQDANRWYIITCACSVIFLLFYLLFVTQIILITSKNGYVFPPASPFRDAWDQDQLWYESHFQAPSKFPYAFWMGATVEALAGVPTGQMIVSVTLVIISLLTLGAGFALLLPRITPKRQSRMVFA